MPSAETARAPARHALVTGASSGIGAAIATRLLTDGWRVTGISRRRGDIDHPSYSHLAIDLTSAASLADSVAELEVSAFVHAAGAMSAAPLGQLNSSDSERMWRVHVDVAEQIANAIAPRLTRGGRIVLIGSRTAAGASGRSQYAATKAALVAMARSWAAELAPSGITVNVVAPAATETPMLSDPSRASSKPRLPPIGRYILPAEIAAAVAFLLSEDAAAITGQQIVICGGSSL